MAFTALRAGAEGTGELKPLAERSESSEEAWSGERVVVVGGRVSTVDGASVTVTVTVVTAGSPLFPYPPVLTVGKGMVSLPKDVQLLLAIPPWAPVAAMIEAALFWLVHAINYPHKGSIKCRRGDRGEYLQCHLPELAEARSIAYPMDTAVSATRYWYRMRRHFLCRQSRQL